MSIKDNLEKAANKKQMHEAIADMFERNTPAAKKPFDISEHEFSDGDIDFAFKNGKFLIEIDSDRGIYGEIKKQDVIAIAKALGVTGEDLL